MSRRYAVGDTVICTYGYAKGERFRIVAYVRDGYSCARLADDNGNRAYYEDRHLTLETP